MCCDSVVSSVVVDWRARKPPCVGDRGIRGVIFVRTSHSGILKGLQSSEMGLYEARLVGVLFGLSMDTILAVFQMLGDELFCIEKLKMYVRTLIVTRPRCFKNRYVMSSGTDAVVDLVSSTANLEGGSVLGSCLRFVVVCLAV